MSLDFGSIIDCKMSIIYRGVGTGPVGDYFDCARLGYRKRKSDTITSSAVMNNIDKYYVRLMSRGGCCPLVAS